MIIIILNIVFIGFLSNVCVMIRHNQQRRLTMNKLELMTRSKFHKHKNKMVLFLNFADLNINDAYEVIDYSSGIIGRMPLNSVYTLTDITNS